MSLTQLVGNLGDKTQQSPVVNNVITNLDKQDKISYSDLYLFLAVSGAGKSKAGFDILRKRWGLFLDMSGAQQGHLDIANMYKFIQNHIRLVLFVFKSIW